MPTKFLPDQMRECVKHGLTVFGLRSGRKDSWQCRRCAADSVVRFRQRTKQRLVDEFGGKCVRCGYYKCLAALQFHHRDPSDKEFGIADKGLSRPYEEVLREAIKCDLLCANCHAEVENNGS